jgi:thiol-disulfide isomerase/thioredoxin
LEATHPEIAGKLFEKIAATFQNHPNGQLAAEANSSVESFRKRAAILGKSFSVDGVMADGQPFDWSRYRGKVVLVDFWATWCAPCLGELPNIRTNYDRYHDQGFEVVGVNLDEDSQAVAEFLKFQPLPWTTVVSPDGRPNPLLAKLGVEAIPFVVLVGRDGTALALNVRGESLGKKLQALFPASPPSPAGKTPTP